MCFLRKATRLGVFLAVFRVACGWSAASWDGHTCFGDAIPASKRKNMTRNGVNSAVRIFKFMWTSSRIMSEIARIMLEEKVGFNVEVRAASSGRSWDAIRSLAGCKPSGDMWAPCYNLSESPPSHPQWHLVFDAWNVYIPNGYAATIGVPEAQSPEIIALSFGVGEAMVVRADVARQIYESDGVDLGNYRSYDARWQDVSQYFSTTAHVVAAAGRDPFPCHRRSKHESFQRQSIQNYLKHTRDTGGTVQLEDGSYVARCEGNWWHSPTCRNDTAKCVPFVTLSSDLMKVAMQWAFFLRMPLAIGIYPLRALRTIINTTSVLFLETLHSPQVARTDEVPVPIRLPRSNQVELNDGLYRTELSHGISLKGAIANLEHLSSRVHDFFEKFDLYREEVAEITVWSRMLGHRQAACRFLLEKGPKRWEPWVPTPLVECPVGFQVNHSKRCSPCLPGSYNPVAGAEAKCVRCSPGTYTDTEGMSSFKLCDPGSYSSASAASCTGCLPGKAATSRGLSECAVCERGRSSAGGGTSCDFCGIGTYAGIGAETCQPCDRIIAGSTTLYPGRSRPEECVCGQHLLLFNGSSGSTGQCRPCPEGLVCNAGRGLPLQAAGYYALSLPVDSTLEGGTAPVSVYRCRNRRQCPSGALGSCAPGRTGLSCASCRDGHYDTHAGHCDLCDSMSVLLPVLAAVLLLACTVIAYLAADSDVVQRPLSTVTIVVTLGQLASIVQILGSFRELELNPTEVGSAADLLDFIHLFASCGSALDVVRVQCLLRKDNPMIKLIMVLSSIPGFMLALLGVFGALKAAAGRNFNLNHYLNALGLAAMVFYIPICITVFQPMHCMINPNGLSSMWSNPGVVCWHSQQHVWLMSLAVIGTLLYPILTLAIITYATWKYPRLVVTNRGIHMLTRYGFLFSRFRQSRYFWGVVNLLRNFIITFIPVILPHSGVVQVLLLAVTLVFSLTATAMFMPWRARIANFTELGMSSLLLVFMYAVAGILDARSDPGYETLSGLLPALVALIMVIAVGVMGYSAFCRIFPGTAYGAFLCHHKEGAGSLARYFKMSVGDLTNSRVFLDSDQLKEIEAIFSIVRAQTKNLVVLLTKMTLTRPWCAGEIATAWVNKIPIVPVICDDYTPLDEEALESLETLWPEQQRNLLNQYGIDMATVKEAYRHLAGLEAISLQRFATMQEQEMRVAEVVKRCNLPEIGATRLSIGRHLGTLVLSNKGRIQRLSSGRKPTKIIVLGSTRDVEARTTQQVLARLMRVQMRGAVVVVHSVQDATPHLAAAQYLVIVLTKGLLQDSEFAEVFFSFEHWRKSEPVQIQSVLVDHNFSFPGPDFYAELEREGSRRSTLLAAGFRRLFNVVALPFTPCGSLGSMESEVHDICQRVNRDRQRWNSEVSRTLGGGPPPQDPDGELDGDSLGLVGVRVGSTRGGCERLSCGASSPAVAPPLNADPGPPDDADSILHL